MTTDNQKMAMDIVNSHFNAVHLRQITAVDCDVLYDTITAALDEKDLEMAQLEKDLVNARQELDALRIRSASE